MRAKRTDENQAAIVESLRKCGVRTTLLSALGLDVPDLLCGYGSHWILVEIKKPDSDITRGQMRFIADALGYVGVATNAEQARKIVKQPESHAITDGQQTKIVEWLIRHPYQQTLSVRKFMELINV